MPCKALYKPYFYSKQFIANNLSIALTEMDPPVLIGTDPPVELM